MGCSSSSAVSSPASNVDSDVDDNTESSPYHDDDQTMMKEVHQPSPSVDLLNVGARVRALSKTRSPSLSSDVNTINDIRFEEEHNNYVHNECINDIILTDSPFETLTCSADKSIVRYNWKTKIVLDKWKNHSKSVEKLLYSGMHNVIYSASRDSTIRQWRTATHKEARSFRGHTLPVTALAINADHSQLVSGARDYSLRFWDVNTGEQMSYRVLQGNVVTCLKQSLHNIQPLIVQGSEQKLVNIWDARTLNISASINTGAYIPLNCDLSADGITFITSHAADNTGGGEIKLWDLRMNSLVHSFVGHTASVYSSIYLPLSGAHSDSKSLIASCSDDGTIRIWDCATLSCLSKNRVASQANIYFRSLVAPHAGVYNHSQYYYNSTPQLFDQDQSIQVEQIELDMRPASISLSSSSSSNLFAASEAGSIAMFNVKRDGSVTGIATTRTHSGYQQQQK